MSRAAASLPAPGRPASSILALLTATLLVGGFLAFLLIPASAQESGAANPAVPPPAAAIDPRLESLEPSVLAAYAGLVLLLTLLHAVFAMAETALSAVRPSRIEQLVQEGQRGAAALQRLSEDPRRYIATIQVGITLASFAVAAVAAATLARPLIAPLASLGFIDIAGAQTAAVIVVTLIVALLTMVLGEIAPKSLALQAPDRWALRLSPFVNLCAFAFAPLTWVVLRLANLLVAPFGATAQFETPMITKQELEQIIDSGTGTGELDKDEQEILTNVIDFSETRVRSVMTPRIDMTALPVDSSLETLLDTIIASGHTRIPAYEGTIDRIIGIVHAKDLLPLLKAAGQGQEDIDLCTVMREPYFVPETKHVDELLEELRRSKQQLAIVQDEYAGTEGIVTIEDLLEEIVGEIGDEYDVDEPEVQVLSPTESIIDGRMSIDDVSDRLGLDLPHEDYETIGGLVFGLLGHEPTPGESVRFSDMEFVVENVEGRRIRSLRAVRLSNGDGVNAATTPDKDDEAAEEADSSRRDATAAL